jgi:hypothetical protein
MNSAIFKIMPAAGSNFNAVNYNEKKVKQGTAGLVYFENFGNLQDRTEIAKEEFKKYLQNYSARNTKIKNPVFHATCSCKGRELTHAQLKEMALEIMQQLGYGENPILIYEHHDTRNNHVHIVSSRVGISGKKIKDNFEGKKANHILNAILNREPHQEFNLHLNNALTYQFGTQAQFALLMEVNGYKTQKKEGQFIFFKHGEKQGSIALSDIDKKITIDENAERNIKQTKAIVYKYRKQYSGVLRSNHDNRFTTEQKKFESDLTNVLKQKFGLDFIFFTAKDKDKPYGYTIIDHRNREVHKGSDILKLDYLITDFVVKEHKDFTTADIEIRELQNKKNSPSYEFYKTLSEENKTAYVVGENTSNNKIQLGDLFEDFIRELEKENYESNGRARKKGRRMRGA